jgi:hypothetical protein
MESNSTIIRNTIFAIIGVIVVPLSIALMTNRQSVKDRQIKEKEIFEAGSVTYKPDIVIDSIDTEIQIYFSRPNPNSISDIKKIKVDKDTLIVEIGSKIVVNRFIRFKNIGQNDAYVNAYLGGDSITGKTFLRRYLFHLKDTVKIKNEDAYYDNRLLKAGSVYAISFRDTVDFFTDSTFSLHFVLLYSNLMGNYYDNYYIHRYPNFIIDGTRLFMESEIPYYRYCLSEVKCIDTLSDFKVYTQDEVKRIKDNWPNKVEN